MRKWQLCKDMPGSAKSVSHSGLPVAHEAVEHWNCWEEKLLILLHARPQGAVRQGTAWGLRRMLGKELSPWTGLARTGARPPFRCALHTRAQSPVSGGKRHVVACAHCPRRRDGISSKCESRGRDRPKQSYLSYLTGTATETEIAVSKAEPVHGAGKPRTACSRKSATRRE